VIGCDMMSLSAHKIHAPKGVGCLYVRNPEIISPLVNGGSVQEFGLRGGTENVPGIVGFGKACELLSQSEYNTQDKAKRFYDKLRAQTTVHKNGVTWEDHSSNSATMNLRFPGVDGETLLVMLDDAGVCISSGSACRSHESTPSHVLKAMGLSDDDAHECVRVSISSDNTDEELETAVEQVVSCVEILRNL